MLMGKSLVFPGSFLKGVEASLPTACITLKQSVKQIAKPVTWHLSPSGSLKLNTDASVTTGCAVGGGILRDHLGRMVLAFYTKFGHIEVLEAKARALHFGLKLCGQIPCQGLIAEVDLQVLHHLILDKLSARWLLSNVLTSIRNFLHHLQGSVHHVFRETNKIGRASCRERV